jgi:hypothetical protein
MDARLEQGFVGVDVPQTGDDVLVEQKSFDLAASVEGGGEVASGQLQRFEADTAHGLRLVRNPVGKAPDTTETPGIAEAQFTGDPGKVNLKVAVFFDRGGLGIDGQPPAHAQSEHQSGGRFTIHDYPLGPAMNADHPATRQNLLNPVVVAVQDVTSRHRDRPDRQTY